LDGISFSATQFARLVALHADDTLSSRLAREVLTEMIASGESPDQIVDRLGLKQISDEGALLKMVHEVLEAHADRVQAYKDGKTGLIGFFMGQVMAKSGGAANPGTVKGLLERELGA